ncbi:MAG: SRPBCC family protein [Anaerolineae bacterium]
MARIEASVVINRPIEEVFAFVTDSEKMSHWMSELVEAKQTSEGPVGVGTTYMAVATPLGRRAESTQEVVEYEPNRKFAFKSTSGPVASKDNYTFESVAGGTKVTRVAEAETGGFFRLAEPLAVRMMQRQFKTNFAHLKDLLEAQAQGSA